MYVNINIIYTHTYTYTYTDIHICVYIIYNIYYILYI